VAAKQKTRSPITKRLNGYMEIVSASGRSARRGRRPRDRWSLPAQSYRTIRRSNA
jgi:hypothetical protein